MISFWKQAISKLVLPFFVYFFFFLLFRLSPEFSYLVVGEAPAGNRLPGNSIYIRDLVSAFGVWYSNQGELDGKVLFITFRVLSIFSWEFWGCNYGCGFCWKISQFYTPSTCSGFSYLFYQRNHIIFLCIASLCVFYLFDILNCGDCLRFKFLLLAFDTQNFLQKRTNKLYTK